MGWALNGPRTEFTFSFYCVQIKHKFCSEQAYYAYVSNNYAGSGINLLGLGGNKGQTSKINYYRYSAKYMRAKQGHDQLQESTILFGTLEYVFSFYGADPG